MLVADEVGSMMTFFSLYAVQPARKMTAYNIVS